MTTLQKIVKEAKALRKKYPKKYAKWTDYVKAASKKISGLDKVTKSGNKTTVHYTKKSPATKKRAAPKKAVQSSLFGVKKKAAPRSSHKDTKSHNVNIRVVSGTHDLNFWNEQLKRCIQQIQRYEKSIFEDKIKAKKSLSAIERNAYKKNVSVSMRNLKILKKELILIKSAIK
jgi:hypothetical protein